MFRPGCRPHVDRIAGDRRDARPERGGEADHEGDAVRVVIDDRADLSGDTGEAGIAEDADAGAQGGALFHAASSGHIGGEFLCTPEPLPPARCVRFVYV